MLLILLVEIRDVIVFHTYFIFTLTFVLSRWVGGGGCLAMVQNRVFVNTHYISKCYLYIIAGFVITETVFQ